MTEIKIPVFKIVQWVDKNTKNIFLFVGKNKKYENLLSKLKTKDINKDEEDILKTYYKNYKLLEKTLQDKKINAKIIYENIYEDDTIFTMKNKLCMYTNNKMNYEHLYLWYKRTINDFELIDILNKIFNKREYLKISEINEIFQNLFVITKLNKTSQNKNIKEVYDILKKVSDNLKAKFKRMYIYIPLEINYYDENKNPIFINYNPCDNIEINKKFITDDGDYIPIYGYKIDSFSILKSKWNENDDTRYTINYIVSSDILEFATKKINQNKSNIGYDNDKIIFNGYLKQYFPYLQNLKNIHNFDKQNEKTIKEVDEKINNIYSLDIKKDFLDINVLLHRMNFRILPVLVNNTKKKSIYNLETLFNNYELTTNIPFIIYKKKNK